MAWLVAVVALVRRHAPGRNPLHDDLAVLRIIERPADDRLAVVAITLEAVVTLAGDRARIVDARGALVTIAFPRVDVAERAAPPQITLAGEARRAVRARAVHAGLLLAEDDVVTVLARLLLAEDDVVTVLASPAQVAVTDVTVALGDTRPVAAAHIVTGVASGARGTVHGPAGASGGAALAAPAPSSATVFVRGRATLARPPLVTFACERVGSRRCLRHAAAVDARVIRAGPQGKQIRTPSTTVREDGQQQRRTRPPNQALRHIPTTYSIPAAIAQPSEMHWSPRDR